MSTSKINESKCAKENISFVCPICCFKAKNFRGLQIHAAVHKKNMPGSSTGKDPRCKEVIYKRERENDMNNLHHSKNSLFNFLQ